MCKVNIDIDISCVHMYWCLCPVYGCVVYGASPIGAIISHIYSKDLT